MPNLVGTGLNQVPTNSMLGGLAYQDPEHASIKDLDLKNLSQINSEIADTAVDVFVYDTRKDSDGGAWRKRTQHTSWYNETLGTATRGNRREFPSVAVIVIESEHLKIYDGDDPNLPMWMVFEHGVQYILGCNGDNLFSVVALNGIIVVGENESYGGVVQIKFISDTAIRLRGTLTTNGTNGQWIRNIEERNSGYGNARGYDNAASFGRLIDDNVNDVAMTVLPNAPIDPSTGLPVPTIACLVGETQVTLENGETKRIDEIKPGEFVKTLEGSHEVLNWFDQGIKETIELEFDNGTKLTCTLDHKIRTTDGWVEAGNLTEQHEIISL